MHPLVNIAVNAARRAGNVITRAIPKLDALQVQTKGRHDFVSDVDRMAEAEIIQVIRKAYPDHAILAEESGAQGSAEVVWLIDPLDGTTNFLHNFPHYAVSIAVQIRGRLEHGIIYDPVRQELFTASRGSGVQLDGRRVRVSRLNGVEGALLGTGFPFRQPQRLEVYLKTFNALFPQAADIRRAGSAALDLAYVAAGRLDGYWEFGLQPWDMGAGALMVQESGGLVGDFGGGSNFLSSGNIVAGSPKVFKGMLQAIHPCLPPELRK
ncbi:inositol-1-monophosphatase [Thioalbus denitrificans]|uniref:Inositol-1-monophosphatase n=1 Tax=Thioalbus denitrificans TaxID=547122 RepID=A0A369CJ02_9GAMM|nr:inositol-1-monophosphatase [Thioalbus denitrificans]RCX31824.1 myo-inositol-1(or 4)-monophosphatase [Thioalbus denitrificans]